MKDMDGFAFHTLWKFHRACSAAAVSAISGHRFKWITSEQTAAWGHFSGVCSCKNRSFIIGPKSQRMVVNDASWGGYIDLVREILKVHPCSEAITQYEIFQPFYKVKMCEGCRESICGLSEFSRYLREEVERLVSNVPLDLPF
ncbi:hypothetical protein BJV74DRAFT_830141 [Russula compacta]|nr:hypothetical protein BJV74DRAFT_830141 [Russula compacta]